jgi:hypothetical protein
VVRGGIISEVGLISCLRFNGKAKGFFRSTLWQSLLFCCKRLVSVHRLLLCGYSVRQNALDFEILDSNGNLVGIAPPRDGVYMIHSLTHFSKRSTKYRQQLHCQLQDRSVGETIYPYYRSCQKGHITRILWPLIPQETSVSDQNMDEQTPFENLISLYDKWGSAWIVQLWQRTAITIPVNGSTPPLGLRQEHVLAPARAWGSSQIEFQGKDQCLSTNLSFMASSNTTSVGGPLKPSRVLPHKSGLQIPPESPISNEVGCGTGC